MNTKLLMTISAFILGIVGIILSFLPLEVSKYLEMVGTNSIILQILGALYFGFAMLNWTAKANLIGGIYSRPVAIGNFTHFFIGGLALAKLSFKNLSLTYILITTITYSIFAILFGYVLLLILFRKKNLCRNGLAIIIDKLPENNCHQHGLATIQADK